MPSARLVRVLLVGGSVIAVPIALFADQRPASDAFEVASVRLSPADSRQSQQILDTRVTLAGQPLQSVMRLAFRATDYQLSAPAWLNRAATRQQVPEMLPALLAERFGLGCPS